MKKIFVCMIVLIVVSVSLAAPVNIPDPNLKLAIENLLGPDPEPADMQLLTTFTANSKGIVNLTGLEEAKNLVTLSLQENDINDLSPLAGLTKLGYLYLQKNSRLSDLSPLSALVNMKYFKVIDCNISDINIVSSFPLLQALSAGDSPHKSSACNSSFWPGDNRILSLEPLRGRTTLRYLYIYGNDINDLSPLSTIPGLLELDVAHNRIADVSALSGLTNLTFLNIRCNDVNDISMLSGLTKLIYFFASYTNDINDISDVNAVSKMTKLAELGLSKVNLVDISPLADVNQIKVLWLGDNKIKDINALMNYQKLTKLNLRNNPLDFNSWCPYLRQIYNNNPALQIIIVDPNDPPLDTMPILDSLINYYSTDFIDLHIFSNHWLHDGESNTTTAFCNCSDLNNDANVNFIDYAEFADIWKE